jgi:hypothetical protein
LRLHIMILHLETEEVASQSGGAGAS